MKTVLKFIFALVLSFLPGLIGVIFTPGVGGDNWFDLINKSVLTPAGWVFGVAWTALYTILGVALFLVMRNREYYTRRWGQYVLFAMHAILNAAWCWAFFGAHLTELALVILMALLCVALAMTVAFGRANRVAGILIWPYVLWLTFAFYLNATVVCLN